MDYGGDEGGNSLAIWKACGLNEMLHPGILWDSGGLKWEIVIAKVDTRPPIRPADTTDVSLEHGDEEDEDDYTGTVNGHRTMREGNGQHRYDENRNRSNQASSSTKQQSARNEATIPKPSFTLPRGEAQGGQYNPTHRGHAAKDSFILYGGMHHHNSLTETSLQATTILGDVWKLDYESETLSLLCPYPPLPWQVSILVFVYYVDLPTAPDGTI